MVRNGTAVSSRSGRPCGVFAAASASRSTAGGKVSGTLSSALMASKRAVSSADCFTATSPLGLLTWILRIGMDANLPTDRLPGRSRDANGPPPSLCRC